MDVWALRRRQFVWRYGMWLTVLSALGLIGAYVLDPKNDAWTVAARGLTHAIEPVASAMVKGVTTGAEAKAALASVAMTGSRTTAPPPRHSVAGYPDSEVRCLALAVYHEAAGEKVEAMKAVAQVAVNRAAFRKDAKSLCKVIYLGMGLQHGCLFQATCRRIGTVVPEGEPAWSQALDIAVAALESEFLVPRLAEATHFHSVMDAPPPWTRGLHRVAILGHFVFYTDHLVEETLGKAMPVSPEEHAGDTRAPRPRPARRVVKPSGGEGGAAGRADLSTVFARGN